jgi:hypothetical protein
VVCQNECDREASKNEAAEASNGAIEPLEKKKNTETGNVIKFTQADLTTAPNSECSGDNWISQV